MHVATTKIGFPCRVCVAIYKKRWRGRQSRILVVFGVKGLRMKIAYLDS